MHLQWSNVMFTYDSCFAVRPVKNILHVWRHEGKRMNPKFVVSSFKSGYQTVAVSAASPFLDTHLLLKQSASLANIHIDP